MRMPWWLTTPTKFRARRKVRRAIRNWLAAIADLTEGFLFLGTEIVEAYTPALQAIANTLRQKDHHD